MKYYITFIIFFSSFSLYCNQEYQLKYDFLLQGESAYDLNLINNQNNNNLFYSGQIENIEEILYINKDYNHSLTDGKHTLINMLGANYFKYINLFPTKTIFIIWESNKPYIKNYYTNYTFFSIYNGDYIFYSKYFNKKDIYYVKLGKKFDNTLLNVFIFFIFF